MGFLDKVLSFMIYVMFGFEEKRVADALTENEKTALKLKLLENENANNKKYDGVPDADVVNDIIRRHGGGDSDTI